MEANINVLILLRVLLYQLALFCERGEYEEEKKRGKKLKTD